MASPKSWHFLLSRLYELERWLLRSLKLRLLFLPHLDNFGIHHPIVCAGEGVVRLSAVKSKNKYI